MVSRTLAIIAALAFLTTASSSRASCEFNLALAGFVRDSATLQMMPDVRVYYGTMSTITDEYGYFTLFYSSIVGDGEFFPSNYCVMLYSPGYNVKTECIHRGSVEPFPPCSGGASLFLSLSYGTIYMSKISTDVKDEEAPQPQSFELKPNYPNPFNPATEIEFVLAAPAAVQLDVFDVLGRHVANLARRHLEAGSHTVRWDSGDAAAGVYFYRLRVGDDSRTQKMLLLK